MEAHCQSALQHAGYSSCAQQETACTQTERLIEEKDSNTRRMQQQLDDTLNRTQVNLDDCQRLKQQTYAPTSHVASAHYPTHSQPHCMTADGPWCVLSASSVRVADVRCRRAARVARIQGVQARAVLGGRVTLFRRLLEEAKRAVERWQSRQQRRVERLTQRARLLLEARAKRMDKEKEETLRKSRAAEVSRDSPPTPHPPFFRCSRRTAVSSLFPLPSLTFLFLVLGCAASAGEGRCTGGG